MGKDKLRRFAENLTFDCMIQPEFEDIFNRDHPLKGRWHKDFFHNDKPIVLELGCGKGEYTIALHRHRHQGCAYVAWCEDRYRAEDGECGLRAYPH